MVSPLTSTCALCRLRISRAVPTQRTLTPIQNRGKKINARLSPTMDVKLIKNLKGYGRKGTIVPVPNGVMRNEFFPKKIAAYLSFEEARKLKKSGFRSEKDVEYKSKSRRERVALQKKTAADTRALAIKKPLASKVSKTAPAGESNQIEPQRGVEINMLEPKRAFEVLSRIIPSVLRFQRYPIPGEDLETAAIYGSVSSADALRTINTLISLDAAAAGHIKLTEKDVRFLDADEKTYNLRRLGRFEAEIFVKDQEAIRREILISAKDGEAPADEAGRAPEDESYNPPSLFEPGIEAAQSEPTRMDDRAKSTADGETDALTQGEQRRNTGEEGKVRREVGS